MPDFLRINFDKWLPDINPLDAARMAMSSANGGQLTSHLSTLTNLLPEDTGYKVWPSQAAYSSNAVTDIPYSIREFLDDVSLYYYPFIGTSTKIYRLETTKALTDVSIAGGYDPQANAWCMIKVGNWVIATDYRDNIQVLKGISTAANFAALGGSPPKCRYLCHNNGHLLLAFLNDGTVYPQKVQWSAYGSYEDFAASLTTGAGSLNLTDSDGAITGMVNIGNSVMIFHKNSITMADYVGVPETFKFLTNKFQNAGAIPGSPVVVDNIAYFFDERSFYKCDGQSKPVRIGIGVNDSILSYFDYGYDYRVQAAVDKRKGIIYWTIKLTSDGVVNYATRIVAYNYNLDRFAIASTNHYGIEFIHVGAVSWDDIDAIWPNTDLIPYPADSNYWLANASKLATIGTDLKVATFSGSALAGSINTHQVRFGEINYINEARILVEQAAASSVDLAIKVRNKEADALTSNNFSVVDSTGFSYGEATGRYQEFDISLTGEHLGITGIEVNPVLVGRI